MAVKSHMEIARSQGGGADVGGALGRGDGLYSADGGRIRGYVDRSGQGEPAVLSQPARALRARGDQTLRPGQERGLSTWRGEEEASGGGFSGSGLTHGREYSEHELWENFASFIKEVLPVAEEAGVRIGIHPDDPPGVAIGGVPRPIFSSFDGYRRALDIADSPNIGLCLCIGCWLEGGENMGKGVVDTIKHFGGQGKIFKVHYRNVDQPLPHFIETFVDDGYFDMYEAMKALEEVGYNGTLIPDHIPQMGDDGRLGTAYTLTYMRALQKRAEDEVNA